MDGFVRTKSGGCFGRSSADGAGKTAGSFERSGSGEVVVDRMVQNLSMRLDQLEAHAGPAQTGVQELSQRVSLLESALQVSSSGVVLQASPGFKWVLMLCGNTTLKQQPIRG